MGCFSHAGVFVDFGENGDDGSAVVVGYGFDFCLGGGERLRGDGSVCIEESLDDLGDSALEEPCVVVNEVGKAVSIEGSVDLLHDGSFNEIAGVESKKVVFEAVSGVFDLGCC